MKSLIYTQFILLLTLVLNAPVKGQVTLDLEAGLAFTGYNDVRIPGDVGTAFSLKSDLNARSSKFYRIRAGYTINSRHTFSVLYAPLELISDGRIPKDISFAGKTFPENSLVDGTYVFNSYRLTYRYDLVHKPGFEFGLGFTAKIRDASISLASPGLYAEKTNVGFVPIINFRFACQCFKKVGFLLEGDALAAPQGRAEDVLIAATFPVLKSLTFRAGYRILEGGADNSEVYNFALIHYASAGISFTF